MPRQPNKKNLVLSFILKNAYKPYLDISVISKELKISYATAWKWVDILEMQGLIETEKIGGMRVVKKVLAKNDLEAS